MHSQRHLFVAREVGSCLVIHFSLKILAVEAHYKGVQDMRTTSAELYIQRGLDGSVLVYLVNALHPNARIPDSKRTFSKIFIAPRNLQRKPTVIFSKSQNQPGQLQVSSLISMQRWTLTPNGDGTPLLVCRIRKCGDKYEVLQATGDIRVRHTSAQMKVLIQK